jgi:hypothetical protein
VYTYCLHEEGARRRTQPVQGGTLLVRDRGGYFHFLDAETCTETYSDMPRVTQPVSCEATVAPRL